jgi:hypothetical protein
MCVCLANQCESSIHPLPTPHYPLPPPTTHYPLPTTHYPLPTTHYPLPTPHYPLPTTHYPLPTTHFTLHMLLCTGCNVDDWCGDFCTEGGLYCTNERTNYDIENGVDGRDTVGADSNARMCTVCVFVMCLCYRYLYTCARACVLCVCGTVSTFTHARVFVWNVCACSSRYV